MSDGWASYGGIQHIRNLANNAAKYTHSIVIHKYVVLKR